jgi:PAS domain-containing protein
VLAAGVDDYIAKPFELAVMDIRLAVAERQIEIRAARARIEAERARLVEETRSARAQLEAVLDAADEAITLYAPDGTVLRANRYAQRTMAERSADGEILSPAAMHARMRPTLPDGTPLTELPIQRALRGEEVSLEYLVQDASGRVRRNHTQAAPILDAEGRVAAAVVIWRDITDLHDVIATRARLDGAVKTARRVAHELNNQLSCIGVYSHLLADSVDGEAGEFVEEVVKSADEAAAIVARLQKLMRFEETEVAGLSMLDLTAATDPPNREK